MPPVGKRLSSSNGNTNNLADSLTKSMDSSYMRSRLSEAKWSWTLDESVAKKPKAVRTLSQITKAAKRVHQARSSSADFLCCAKCQMVQLVSPNRYHQYQGKVYDLHQPRTTHVCHFCQHLFRTAVPMLGKFPRSLPNTCKAHTR